MKSNKFNSGKFGVLGFCLSLLLFIPVYVYRSQSLLPIDPYWRYQGIIWASNIKNTGGLEQSPFPDHSYLLSWANTFLHNFAAPMIVAIISEITGITVQNITNMPLFAFAILFSTGVIAKRVTENPKAFPLAIVLGVAFKFRAIQMMNTAHRGALSWSLFLTIIAFLLVLRSQDNKERILGFSVLVITFQTSAHTLPISSLVFFVGIFILARFTERDLFPAPVAAVLVITVFGYYTILFGWLGRTVLKFIASIRLLNDPLSLLVDSFFLQSGSASPINPSVISKYLLQKTPSLFVYNYALRLSLVTAVVISCLGVLIRFREHIKQKVRFSRLSTVDIVFFALIIQGLVGIVVQPLFAGSGGINPLVFGIMVTPIFGSYSLLKLGQFTSIRLSDRRRLIAILLLILVLLPAMFSYTYRPMPDGSQALESKPEDKAMLTWNNQYITTDEVIISDFDTLSKYYSFGGNSRTYLPQAGEPAYAEPSRANHLVDLYYRSPAETGKEAGDVFIVSRSMQRYQLFHLGSVKTVPTSKLDKKLSRSTSWNRVYTTGSGLTFVVENNSN